MPFIKAYSISLLMHGSVILAMDIDTAGRKDAEKLARELKDALEPILQIHYDHLFGPQKPLKIKTMVNPYTRK